MNAKDMRNLMDGVQSDNDYNRVYDESQIFDGVLEENKSTAEVEFELMLEEMNKGLSPSEARMKLLKEADEDEDDFTIDEDGDEDEDEDDIDFGDEEESFDAVDDEWNSSEAARAEKEEGSDQKEQDKEERLQDITTKQMKDKKPKGKKSGLLGKGIDTSADTGMSRSEESGQGTSNIDAAKRAKQQSSRDRAFSKSSGGASTPMAKAQQKADRTGSEVKSSDDLARSASGKKLGGAAKQGKLNKLGAEGGEKRHGVDMSKGRAGEIASNETDALNKEKEEFLAQRQKDLDAGKTVAGGGFSAGTGEVSKERELRSQLEIDFKDRIAGWKEAKQAQWASFTPEKQEGIKQKWIDDQVVKAKEKQAARDEEDALSTVSPEEAGKAEMSPRASGIVAGDREGEVARKRAIDMGKSPEEASKIARKARAKYAKGTTDTKTTTSKFLNQFKGSEVGRQDDADQEAKMAAREEEALNFVDMIKSGNKDEGIQGILGLFGKSIQRLTANNDDVAAAVYPAIIELAQEWDPEEGKNFSSHLIQTMRREATDVRQKLSRAESMPSSSIRAGSAIVKAFNKAKSELSAVGNPTSQEVFELAAEYAGYDNVDAFIKQYSNQSSLQGRNVDASMAGMGGEGDDAGFDIEGGQGIEDVGFKSERGELDLEDAEYVVDGKIDGFKSDIQRVIKFLTGIDGSTPAERNVFKASSGKFNPVALGDKLGVSRHVAQKGFTDFQKLMQDDADFAEATEVILRNAEEDSLDSGEFTGQTDERGRVKQSTVDADDYSDSEEGVAQNKEAALKGLANTIANWEPTSERVKKIKDILINQVGTASEEDLMKVIKQIEGGLTQLFNAGQINGLELKAFTRIKNAADSIERHGKEPVEESIFESDEEKSLNRIMECASYKLGKL